MYPKEFFVEQFSAMDTDALLIKLSAQELADNARAAILELLAKRGVPAAQVDALSKASHKAAIRSTRGTSECDFCGNSAKTRAVFDEGQRFCSAQCKHAARISEAAVDFSSTDILQKAQAIRSGGCPVCAAHGTVVEIRFYHRVRSFIYFTRYTRHSALCCVPCGKAQNLRAFWTTMGLGWWSFPGGIFFTPIYLIANLGELFENQSAAQEPSENLLREAKYQLARAATGA
jgi:hypothetical protein